MPKPSLRCSVRSIGTLSSRLSAASSDSSGSAPALNLRYDPYLTISTLLSEGVGTNYATVRAGVSVLEAVESMNLKGKGSVLVVDAEETDQVLGIFTERDFVGAVGTPESIAAPIESLMTPSDRLVFGEKFWSVRQCQEIMNSNKIRHLPIRDASKKVVGVISQRDIVRYLAARAQQSPRFFGESLAEVSAQSKIVANQLALEKGEEGTKQDTLRSAFVVTAGLFVAAILQADWVHTHEELAMIGTFMLGYIGIVFETYFEFNKAAIALMMATALWTIYAGTAGATGEAISTSLTQLSEKVSEVSEVIFFLMGAMTIVEIVDSHQGFKVVTDVIKSKDKRGLMFVIGLITFFMSAILVDFSF